MRQRRTISAQLNSKNLVINQVMYNHFKVQDFRWNFQGKLRTTLDSLKTQNRSVRDPSCGGRFRLLCITGRPTSIDSEVHVGLPRSCSLGLSSSPGTQIKREGVDSTYFFSTSAPSPAYQGTGASLLVSFPASVSLLAGPLLIILEYLQHGPVHSGQLSNNSCPVFLRLPCLSWHAPGPGFTRHIAPWGW